MESRIEIDEQYNDDMRDTRTLRQKVTMHAAACTALFNEYCASLDLFFYILAETRLKAYEKECEKKLAVSYELCQNYYVVEGSIYMYMTGILLHMTSTQRKEGSR